MSLPARSADEVIGSDAEGLQLQEALKRLKPKIARLFSYLRLRPEDAEQLLQDVLMFALVKLRANELESLDGWILTVLKYQGFSFLRAEGRRREKESEAWRLSELRARAAPKIDRVHALAFRRSLDGLRPKHRRVLCLRLEGHTSDEVADRTGYCEKSVRKVVSRAARRLKGILAAGRAPKRR